MATRTTQARGGAGVSASEPAAEPTRARLLDAATEVFAEVGYYRATIRGICARAGANNALVNYYFGDKLALYGQVLHRLVDVARIEAVRAALNQEAPPEEVLRGAIKARLRAVADGGQNGWLFRILAHEIAQPTQAMTGVINGILRPLYNQLYEIVGALIGLPAADEKTRLCAHSIMGQIMIYVLAGPVLARLWPDMKMTPENLERIADHITDFSLAYLQQVREAQQPAAKAAGGRNRE